MPNLNVAKDKRANLVQRSLATLGPGLITGAADDDPSGISTYSVAGEMRLPFFSVMPAAFADFR